MCSLLCRFSFHIWRHETRATPGPPARASLFYLRFCQRCAKAEIEVRPLMGTRKWVPLDPWPESPIPSVTAWEKSLFAVATVENCRKHFGDYFQQSTRRA